MEELQSIAKNIRKSILKMTLYSKSSHIGSALSIVEILTILYFQILKIDPKIPDAPDRDIFILSKAHGSGAALYSILAEKGFFSKSFLDKYYVDEGVLPGHVDKDSVPGIEFSTGSLGHGFPVAVGMAIANNTSENKRKDLYNNWRWRIK